MITILHNNNCSKSRAVLQVLMKNEVEFEIIDLISNPLSEAEISTLLEKLGIDAHSLIRTNENLYRNQFEGKDFSEKEWITILSENPSLIQRPILINGEKAMIARPVESVKFFIGK